MALSRVKTWASGEVLTASDLNGEFNNILNNGTSLVSPFTAAVDFDGNTITLDAAGNTTVVSSTSVSWNFTSGVKSGSPVTTGSTGAWAGQTYTDSATAGSGTATAHVFHNFAQPGLAATNASVTTTDAATVRIGGAPTAGTNQTITNAWALWVDSGDVRLDGSLTIGDAAADTLTINAETVSQPNIPCFLAYNSAPDTNQTGNGATVTVDFDTEVFDQSGDFASDTFTAPATGRYLLSTQVTVSDLTAAMTTQSLTIVTSNRSYLATSVNVPSAGEIKTLRLAVIADMDSADTATVTLRIVNGAGDTADIDAGADMRTYFSGMRVA